MVKTALYTNKNPIEYTALNCARNCLRYIVKTLRIKEIHIPYYICPAVWQALQKENCRIKFYHIDKNFLPDIEFDKNAYILYVNYFGICASQMKQLAAKYKNLAADNSHAFYMPQYGAASFNSLRKFFKVPDGAFVYTADKADADYPIDDKSCARYSHLLKLDEINPESCPDFQEIENSFYNEPVKLMSDLTKELYKSIDLNLEKQMRLERFHYLHERLSKTNGLKITLDKDDVPMAYPYLSRDKASGVRLAQNGIYFNKYWGSLSSSQMEYELQEYIYAFPLDSRCSIDYLNKTADALSG